MSHWINFTELRKQLPFADVLAYYKVRLEQKGDSDQHVGTCPLPTHRDAKGKTFSANFAKGVWQCFGCHESGNIIDLAVLLEGKDKKDGKAVRAVAISLRERFVEKRSDNAQGRPEPKPEAMKSAAPVAANREAALPVVINEPLNFALKTLDTAHPYFEEHKLLPETVARFGLGFCGRGSLSGRVAVPLHDDAAQLIGYTGLHAEGKSGEARYIFPAPREHESIKHVFDRGKFLYNGHRISKAVRDLIVVRECHTVWHLHQGGFPSVVALMGDECSREQGENIALLAVETARIWLLTDSSPESQNAARSFLPQVASSRLCRWIKVGTDDEIVPDHPLLKALLKR